MKQIQTSLDRYIYRLIVVFTIVVIFTVLPASAQGGYPQPTGSYVNDFAGLLTAEDAAHVEQLFADLKTQHGIEATLVTI